MPGGRRDSEHVTHSQLFQVGAVLEQLSERFCVKTSLVVETVEVVHVKLLDTR